MSQPEDVNADDQNAEAQAVLETIRRRRVCRAFTDDPVDEQHLRTLLVAARWAPSAGNRRINKFVVIQNQEKIDLVRQVAPGMLGRPTAIIVICTDLLKAKEEGIKVDLDERNTYIDVGAAAQNIMLAAEVLGLGTCPATSFSMEAVRTILELPSHLIPDYIVQVGHPQPQERVLRSGASLKLTIDDISYWETVPGDS
jgi:nitroreductase